MLMGKKEVQPYFIGLDMGTNSCGWAVTDEHYHLLKDKWGDLWGSHLYDEAATEKERRTLRESRRQIQRKQNRRTILQQIFESEIAPIDPNFFERQAQSRLKREDSDFSHSIFEDADFTDSDYWKTYPSIHHLIVDLIRPNPKKKDPRLVYLACLWLLENRGSFLYGDPALVSQAGDEAVDVKKKWGTLLENLFDTLENCQADWTDILPQDKPIWLSNQEKILQILSSNKKYSEKLRDLKTVLGDKLLFVQRLLLGKDVDLSFFVGDRELVKGKISLSTDTDAFHVTLDELNISDSSLREALLCLEEIYAFACVKRILGDDDSISMAKVRLYDKRKADLKNIKSLLRTQFPNDYSRFFRSSSENLYGKSCQDKEKGRGRKKFIEELRKLLSSQTAQDSPQAQKILEDMDRGTFLPIQRASSNSVIPCSFYYTELYHLLRSASSYVSCLSEKDSNGLSNMDKILKTFSFKIPYYIGPLNQNSEFSWFSRKKEGKIYPWNFSEIIDEDKSEIEFIEKAQGFCTYLPWEKTLPKNSLIYSEFKMWNLINVIKVEGHFLDLEQRKRLFKDFKTNKTISIGKIAKILNTDSKNLSGVDKSTATGALPFIKFKKFFDSGILTSYQAEEIIRYTAYIHDKNRIFTWLKNKYQDLSQDEAEELSSLGLEGFGKLSEAFLTQIPGSCKDAGAGNPENILCTMRKYPVNLMQLLSSRWTFGETIKEKCAEHYSVKEESLEDKLLQMHLSNPVKRMVTRAVKIVEEIIQSQGKEPEKIFIEVTRSHEENPRQPLARKEKITKLYNNITDTEATSYNIDKKDLIKRLNEEEEKLQKQVVYLYCMQLGKDIYTGKKIDFDALLKGSEYDIDHIWPRSVVKDDSLDNIVLTNKKDNIDKGNLYPINPSIQKTMKSFWIYLHSHNMMSDEKFNRLLRTKPFTNEERFGFVHRQLVETSQATKAAGRILEEKYKNTKIVLSRAKYASEYRYEFGFPKSRLLNDMHHAKDAYLNVVVGNIFDERFTEDFFTSYPTSSIKIRSVFGKEALRSWRSNKKIIWEGKNSQDLVTDTMHKNNVRLTRYSYKKTGEFYDQNPKKYSNDSNYYPIKRGLPVEKYGGYSGIKRAFWILCECNIEGKKECMFVPIDVMNSRKVQSELQYRKRYLANEVSVLTSKPENEIEILGCYPTLEHPKMIKIQSVLSLDGFQVLLKSISGSQIKVDYQTPLFFDRETKIKIKDHGGLKYVSLEDYESYLERWRDKVGSDKNKAHGVCEPSDMEYFKDKITKENNSVFYESIIKKLFTKPFLVAPAKGSIRDSLLKSCKKNRICPNEIDDILDKFDKLTLSEQVQIILGDIEWFNEKTSQKRISCKLSTLSKNYSEVRLIDYSPAALDRRISKNLLNGSVCHGEL